MASSHRSLFDANRYPSVVTKFIHFGLFVTKYYDMLKGQWYLSYVTNVTADANGPTIDVIGKLRYLDQ